MGPNPCDVYSHPTKSGQYHVRTLFPAPFPPADGADLNPLQSWVQSMDQMDPRKAIFEMCGDRWARGGGSTCPSASKHDASPIPSFSEMAEACHPGAGASMKAKVTPSPAVGAAGAAGAAARYCRCPFWLSGLRILENFLEP